MENDGNDNWSSCVRNMTITTKDLKSEQGILIN